MAANRQRLDRFLSRQLNVNRKQIKALLATTEVLVDGEQAYKCETLVDDFSHIVCDGKTLQKLNPVYLMVNKPIGVLSATKDSAHSTVIEIIDHPKKNSLHIAGRLDLNSSGLLLLTNDGRWSSALTSPVNKIAKVYLVTLANPLTSAYIDAFAAGMYFPYEGLTTLPALLEIINTRHARVTLYEGRYHQIKRMFGRFNNQVLSLHRISVGNIHLDPCLEPGACRVLEKDEYSEVF